ncbi:hypothetical protein C9374_011054 [Naegleria lovaniensis]|uniref:Sugar phosphate transporter domain-containing protein n=1 Tax=Naegleria lovaniensis TaxID=51637 RepID=A0AA88GEN4_NAELO|nr:uncharacterized protein C9374_011054 [Naegleria lovaniensis]KAG2374217.1 hypothetical protein C9374_011054 [Naegleria lovaniensis]
MSIVVGMCFVIYGDFYLNLTGSIIALMAILFGATSQIAINYYCKEYDINGFELLFNHSIYSSIFLAILAFPVDGVESISHSMNRFLTDPSFFNVIIISCFAAFIVNVAGYLVIGKLSPLTFQVLGHAKTISILIGGFLFFDQENELNPIKLFGILIALAGTIAYSYIKYQQEIKKDQSTSTSSVSTSENVAKHEPLPQSEQEADDLEANLEKQSSTEQPTNEVVTTTVEELPVQESKK